MIPPIVDGGWLRAHPDAVLADVRWYLDGRDPEAAYAAGHLPGAVRVDMDRVLAAPASSAGRHPLPGPEVFAAGLATAGIGDADTVVAYDDAGGVVAARLVWMLRAVGCDAALLDGGLDAWDGEVVTGQVRRPPAQFALRPWPTELVAGIADVAAVADDPTSPEVLLDVRPADRYAGAPDPLDPRAGHIPGARNLPCRDHLGPDGRLLAVPALLARFAGVGVAPGTPVISSCGSGVTACHTLLVMEHAGLGAGRLYPGSWSEWSRSDRLAVTGLSPRTGAGA